MIDLSFDSIDNIKKKFFFCSFFFFVIQNVFVSILESYHQTDIIKIQMNHGMSHIQTTQNDDLNVVD